MIQKYLYTATHWRISSVIFQCDSYHLPLTCAHVACPVDFKSKRAMIRGAGSEDRVPFRVLQKTCTVSHQSAVINTSSKQKYRSYKSSGTNISEPTMFC